jgi:hypothetical protein
MDGRGLADEGKALGPAGLPRSGDAPIVVLVSFVPSTFEVGGMKRETITCRDCGLVMEIKPGAAGSTLSYDVQYWRQRCKRVELGGPVWCLIERDGTAAQKN